MAINDAKFQVYFFIFSFAGPKKMWKKQIKPFFNLHETKI